MACMLQKCSCINSPGARVGTRRGSTLHGLIHALHHGQHVVHDICHFVLILSHDLVCSYAPLTFDRTLWLDRIFSLFMITDEWTSCWDWRNSLPKHTRTTTSVHDSCETIGFCKISMEVYIRAPNCSMLCSYDLLPKRIVSWYDLPPAPKQFQKKSCAL